MNQFLNVYICPLLSGTYNISAHLYNKYLTHIYIYLCKTCASIHTHLLKYRKCTQGLVHATVYIYYNMNY